jgi:hypothetical protein
VKVLPMFSGVKIINDSSSIMYGCVKNIVSCLQREVTPQLNRENVSRCGFCSSAPWRAQPALRVAYVSSGAGSACHRQSCSVPFLPLGFVIRALRQAMLLVALYGGRCRR